MAVPRLAWTMWPLLTSALSPAHVNVGFFQGASLKDPAGSARIGKRMRHVKLRWGEPVNETALHALILAAYRDMRVHLQ